MIPTLIALVLAGYAALVAGMYLFQRKLMYLPIGVPGFPADSGVPEMDGVTLTTTDGLRLMSWYGAADADRPTIVYFHGNAGHLGYRAERVRPFLDAGFGVLLVEYRGYGGNPGSPTEQGLYRDGRAALGFLQERGIGAGQTVVYGESLGSAVAVHVAAESAQAGDPVAAVVLEAPFTSASDVGAHHYPFVPVRRLIKDRFESVSRVAEIKAPLLIVHGDADRVVPVSFGRALYQAAREPKQALWVDGGEHENLVRFGLYPAVFDFLERNLEKER